MAQMRIILKRWKSQSFLLTMAKEMQITDEERTALNPTEGDAINHIRPLEMDLELGENGLVYQ